MKTETKPKNNEGPKTIAENRRARFDYFIEERYEAGLVLEGWEVKALRAGKAQITESHVFVRDGEVFWIGAHINPLKTTSTHVIADPARTRKLLLNHSEIAHLIGAVERKGYTIVPLELCWSRGKAKLRIGLAKGKKHAEGKPVLLGITMWLTFKLNPTATDPVQAQMFAIMPWILMFVMEPFAAGLLLYWVTSNLLTLAQQSYLYSKHPQLKAAAAKEKAAKA